MLGENEKILVAMSGGVASSVTAALLKTQGYSVMGVQLQFTPIRKPGSVGPFFESHCSSLVDFERARQVCQKLNVPYYRVDVSEVFEALVVDDFVHEVLQGRLPNPCLKCNSQIKFKFLFQKANELGCKWVATGHRVQIVHDTQLGEARIFKAIEARADQTPLLFNLNQEQLKRTLTPLGSLTEAGIEKLANEFNLGWVDEVHKKEACFIDHPNYVEFIEKRTAPSLRAPGLICSQGGEDLGHHSGLFRFQIGNPFGGIAETLSQSADYVTALDSLDNKVIVGPEKELYQRKLLLSQVNWIHPVDELRGLQLMARFDLETQEVSCYVTSFENKMAHVEFAEPQGPLIPGQALVFYQGDELLGGGIVEKAAPSESQT